MEAVSSRNCAMTIATPAAMSWVSEMSSEVKARALATTNDATAMKSSTRRGFI